MEALGQETELSRTDEQLIKLWASFDEMRVETGGETLRPSGPRVLQTNMQRVNRIIDDIGDATPDTVADLTTKTRPTCQSNQLSVEVRLDPAIDNLNSLIRNDPEQNLFAIKSHAEIGKNKVLEILFGRLCQ